MPDLNGISAHCLFCLAYNWSFTTAEKEDFIMAKTISKEELKQKFDNSDDFTLIEVLEAPSYEKSHIKGAVNIPLAHLAKETSERFQKEDELIVYCADFDCSASPKAADKLESIGFSNVWDFSGGKKEWKEAGYPMEEGKS